jgi:hypothetical protein
MVFSPARPAAWRHGSPPAHLLHPCFIPIVCLGIIELRRLGAHAQTGGGIATDNTVCSNKEAKRTGGARTSGGCKAAPGGVGGRGSLYKLHSN